MVSFGKKGMGEVVADEIAVGLGQGIMKGSIAQMFYVVKLGLLGVGQRRGGTRTGRPQVA